MFLFRGVFWIAVVAVFVPREPDGGAMEAGQPAAATAIDSFRENALAQLQRVKAELAAEDIERGRKRPPV